MNTTFLGIELGSTRIKAVSVDRSHKPVGSGDYTWASRFENGVWTYDLDEVWQGLRAALRAVTERDRVGAMGVSAMMHGYLAFDENWQLLTPFRTWQNTITGPAAAELTELLQFNIPQRWSIAHLYQAVLNGEEHVSRIAHITTLAGYVHYMLTGVNAVGVGEASGMFPIDSATLDYDAAMLDKLQHRLEGSALSRPLRELLPRVLTAGDEAGALTEEGAALLEGLLAPGILFAPAEGDAGTGMVATNAVGERTGNVSAGTSIFAMVVLERPLSAVYEEIDMVTTPSGRPVAMVHCNNGTNDSSAWVGLLAETAKLCGAEISMGDLFTRLYEKSLEGDADCGGVTVCNYLAGEGVTHLDAGQPLVTRTSGAAFTLANFFRAQLYASLSTLKLGMDILAGENVAIDSLTGHGGLFKTPGVGQRYLAAACGAAVTCMETAGEGGPYGMALLAAYRMQRSEGETLEQYLRERVFASARSSTLAPDAADAAGFAAYMQRFTALLKAERALVEG